MCVILSSIMSVLCRAEQSEGCALAFARGSLVLSRDVKAQKLSVVWHVSRSHLSRLCHTG